MVEHLQCVGQIHDFLKSEIIRKAKPQKNMFICKILNHLLLHLLVDNSENGL